MKVKLDLSKFKLKHKDDKIATMVHKDGHEIRIAIKALHPENRKNLDSLKMSQGGDVDTQSKLQAAKDSYDRAQPNPFKSKPAAPAHKETPDGTNTFFSRMTDKNKMSEGGRVPHYSNGTDDVEELPPVPAPAMSPNAADFSDAPDSDIDYTQLNFPKGSQPQGNPPPGMDGLKPSLPPPPPAPDMSPPPPADTSSQGLAAPTPAADPMSQVPGYDLQKNALNSSAKIQQQVAQDSIVAEKAKLATDTAALLKFQEHVDDINLQREHVKEDLKNSHIDPNHFMNSKTDSQKVMTSIGLILGGMGGGIHGNQALDYLNRQIENDMQAQKAEIGKKENLLSALTHEFQSAHQAEQMFRVIKNDQLVTQLQMAQAKATGLQAKNNADMMIGQLQAQTAPMVQQLAIRKTLQGGGQGVEQQDPTMFVQHVVPKEQQTAVYKEIERAQNMRKQSSVIKDMYRKAVAATSGAGAITSKLYEPREVQALKALLNTTVTDLTGTARQAEFDSIANNLIPRGSDVGKDAMETREKAMNAYLDSKASAPIAKAYGIDLDKFQSTQKPPETRSINGMQYKKVQGGWAKIQ